ncbi:MAG: LPXTG cell wall anchor domain-containing protein [Enterococcus sp.]
MNKTLLGIALIFATFAGAEAVSADQINGNVNGDVIVAVDDSTKSLVGESGKTYAKDNDGYFDDGQKVVLAPNATPDATPEALPIPANSSINGDLITDVNGKNGALVGESGTEYNKDDDGYYDNGKKVDLSTNEIPVEEPVATPVAVPEETEELQTPDQAPVAVPEELQSIPETPATPDQAPVAVPEELQSIPETPATPVATPNLTPEVAPEALKAEVTPVAGPEVIAQGIPTELPTIIEQGVPTSLEVEAVQEPVSVQSDSEETGLVQADVEQELDAPVATSTEELITLAAKAVAAAKTADAGQATVVQTQTAAEIAAPVTNVATDLTAAGESTNSESLPQTGSESNAFLPILGSLLLGFAGLVNFRKKA